MHSLCFHIALSTEVLYIIVGVGGVMLVAVVVMTVCVVLACAKNRRANIRTADLMVSRVIVNSIGV